MEKKEKSSRASRDALMSALIVSYGDTWQERRGQPCQQSHSSHGICHNVSCLSTHQWARMKALDEALAQQSASITHICPKAFLVG